MLRSTRIRRHPRLKPIFLSKLPPLLTSLATLGLNRAGRIFAGKGPQPESPSTGGPSQRLMTPEKRTWIWR
eukprot:476762-Pyramimonas_sp.AAC.1